jgi:hypothetical protein
MGLCRSRACDCSLTSTSLNIQSLTGGGGYNIETYEGIATESPDTRPGPGERFDGMRVYTTDTRRLFRWQESPAKWVILSEPPQPVLAADFAVEQGAAPNIAKTVNYSTYQRHDGTFDWIANITMNGAGGSNTTIAVYFPAALLTPSSRSYHGTWIILDASVPKFFFGVVGGNTAARHVSLVTSNGGALEFGGASFTVASGDEIQFHVHGDLA